MLDPVLLDFSEERAAMKAEYLGDLFPANLDEASGQCFEDFSGLIEMESRKVWCELTWSVFHDNERETVSHNSQASIQF